MRCKGRNERGVTMVELAVAVGIGAGLMLAMLKFMSYVGRASTQADTRGNAQGDLRQLSNRVGTFFRMRLTPVAGDPPHGFEMMDSKGFNTTGLGHCQDALFRIRHHNKGSPYIETVKVRTVCTESSLPGARPVIPTTACGTKRSEVRVERYTYPNETKAVSVDRFPTDAGAESMAACFVLDAANGELVLDSGALPTPARENLPVRKRIPFRLAGKSADLEYQAP